MLEGCLSDLAIWVFCSVVEKMNGQLGCEDMIRNYEVVRMVLDVLKNFLRESKVLVICMSTLGTILQMRQFKDKVSELGGEGLLDQIEA